MSDLPASDDLVFLPLGGTGEIGMNLNLYGHAGAWLMIDLGITFADDRVGGLDVLMPDPAFIEARRDQLAGLVLTHAHEDHIGAVPYLWPRLRCPIYATPFTAKVLSGKLQEAGLLEEAEITEVPMSGRFSVGPFELELITLTHSIPEPNAVVLRTGAGTVLHTGDWKLDPDPLVGEDYDEAALRGLAGERVLAMICDSTNALVDGDSGSEAEVCSSLNELIGEQKGRVAVACFASNVARVEAVFRAAEAHGRRVALVGRSLLRIFQAARDTGYLAGVRAPIRVEDLGYLPREEVLLLCTGSQGEPRSALWRIVRDEHPHVVLEEGDTVIFSSRVIPGNEISIGRLQNALSRQGLHVVTDRDHFIHVSGHPAREELAQMYQWVRPKIAIPVHGEARHLAEHAELARACQVPQALVAENGELIRLAPQGAEVVERVETGRLALDGTRLVPLGDESVRARQRMNFNGAAMATVVLDGKGALRTDPHVTLQGLLDGQGEEGLEAARTTIREALARLSRAELRDDAAVHETVRVALRRWAYRLLGKRPVTDVHVLRLD
ncbi:MAG: ribonuclease J [Kiloniellales bacterium]|nr:ribonuclease J [Kiloniellales bacterium]